MHLIEVLIAFFSRHSHSPHSVSLALELLSHLAISEETQTKIASSPVLLDRMSAAIGPQATGTWKEKERVLDCIQRICQPHVRCLQFPIDFIHSLLIDHLFTVTV